MATATLSAKTRSNVWPQQNVLLLRMWEAASAGGRVQEVLAAVVEILLPWMPFAAVTVVSFSNDGLRVRGTHVAQKRGRDLQASIACGMSAMATGSGRAHIPFYFSDLQERLRPEKPISCTDLLAKPAWQEHEFLIAPMGTRTYALVPLISSGAMAAAAIFSRTEPDPFTPEQLALLRLVGPALAAAFANALAKENATERIEALQAEVQSLREEICDRDRDGRVPTTPSIQDELLYLRERMLEPEASAQQRNTSRGSSGGTNINAQLEHQERRLIERTLAATYGRISGQRGAALRLGLPASTLEFRIQRLGIDKFQFRRTRNKNAHI